MEIVGGHLTKIYRYGITLTVLFTILLFTIIGGYLLFFKPDVDLIIERVFGTW